VRAKTYSAWEYSIIGCSINNENHNNYISVEEKCFDELCTYAKSEEGSNIFRFVKRGNYLQVQNYVGTIQTKSNYRIDILPKIYPYYDKKYAKKVLVDLLKLLYKIPNYKTTKANLEATNIPLLEIIIEIFTVEIHKLIRRGILSDYISIEEISVHLRGKLKISNQIKRDMQFKGHFNIVHDDYNQNRVENKILKSTLKYLLGVSQSHKVKKSLNIALEHFTMVNYSTNIKMDLKLCQVQKRGMKHYMSALSLAKIFLEHKSLSSFSGSTSSISLLYPMEKLFENYVGWYLLHTENNILSIEGNNEQHNFIKHEKTNKSLLKIRPDFIVKKEDRVIIADAKWKIIKSNNGENKGFSEKDLYQLFAYGGFFAQKYENIELRLYYPKTNENQIEEIYTYIDGKQLRVIFLEMG